MADLTIREKIASQIAVISGDVEQRVIDVIVEKETKKRADALVLVLEKFEKEQKEFFRLGSDLKTFDENGKVLSDGYSKARLEERNKAKQRLTNMQNALEKALTTGDMTNVYKFASGKGPDTKEDTGETTGDTD